MKKFLLGGLCLAVFGLQGCFWHSSEVEHTATPAGTAVVTPSGSTVTTTTSP